MTALIPRSFKATLRIDDAPGNPRAAIEIKVDIPLDATIMHDNMLNAQRAIEQAVYNLFKEYQK